LNNLNNEGVIRPVLFVGVILFSLFHVALVSVPAHANRGPLLKGDTTELAVVGADRGETLTHVTVRVVDTFLERYLGLSRYNRIDTGTGMWFVYDREDTRSFVMRDMRFPLNIVFVDNHRRITRIFRASVERERPLTHYRGRGQWVLEVPMGWSRRHNVTPGDRVVDLGRHRSGE